MSPKYFAFLMRRCRLGFAVSPMLLSARKWFCNVNAAGERRWEQDKICIYII